MRGASHRSACGSHSAPPPRSPAAALNPCPASATPAWVLWKAGVSLQPDFKVRCQRKATCPLQHVLTQPASGLFSPRVQTESGPCGGQSETGSRLGRPTRLQPGHPLQDGTYSGRIQKLLYLPVLPAVFLFQAPQPCPQQIRVASLHVQGLEREGTHLVHTPGSQNLGTELTAAWLPLRALCMAVGGGWMSQ